VRGTSPDGAYRWLHAKPLDSAIGRVLVCRPEDTARGTSPDGAYRWLHAKPLDSAIGRVLEPYGPGDAMVIAVAVGQNTTQNTFFR
jgi:hypothetical protein